MRVVVAFVLLVALIAGAGTGVLPSRASQLWEPPLGTIAGGHIEPVPLGQLYVGVIDRTLLPGESAQLVGPPAFLVSDDSQFGIAGLAYHDKLIAGGSLFLPGGASYSITNLGDKTARFRFIGLGAKGEVKGALYEMEPLPWGPGEGRAYDVTIDRGPFGAGSATPWHIHTGPAFGVLDGGVWENRQLTGDTRRIPTPGYYVQPAGKSHQLAQVGTGGYALIIQFFPPHQPKTTGGPARGDATPTALTLATAIPTANPARPLPTAATTMGSLPAGSTTTPDRVANHILTSLTATPSVDAITATNTTVAIDGPRNNAPIIIAAITTVAVVAALGGLVGMFARRRRRVER